jgi:hypothetical protein
LRAVIRVDDADPGTAVFIAHTQIAAVQIAHGAMVERAI